MSDTEAVSDEDQVQERLRAIPAVDVVLSHPQVARLLAGTPRPLATAAVRALLEGLRRRIRAGEDADVSLPAVAAAAAAAVTAQGRRSLRRAINATGIILHTGLGRAVLAAPAVAALAEVAGSHSLLEIEVESGRRGSRLEHVRGLLRLLAGAPSAAVANNNAAAVLLALNTLAAGKEVVVSRGQLVEIGGSFRMPDIIRASGCRMVEVGTTNKTRLADYEAAITPETALLLQVHPSNFRVVGFTEEVALPELVALGRARSLPVMVDLGSGAFFDVARVGLPPEPTVPAVVASGADIVTFSGDKLLGGPQAGLLLGSEAAIRRVTRNPLMRVLRCDKLILAALEATLRLYFDPEAALRAIPTLRALTRRPDAVRALAQRVVEGVSRPGVRLAVVETASQVGGGSLPTEELPSAAVQVEVEGLPAEDVARALRRGDPPVFGRIHRDLLLLDMRTVAEEEVAEVCAALARARW
ncbi:MAG: L-seryl-tRNA(Sec) selenium transferase [Armatimonadetes bacterium]|nr:L-seryl-tRNA(Sec) selenium transferase [Armatimonadota bacterium]